MRKIDQHIYIANLISKNQLEVINDKESAELNRWRSESSNEDLFRAINEKEGREERKRIIESTSLDFEWNKFNDKQRFVRRRLIGIKILQYAAVLLPVLIASYFFIFLSDRSIVIEKQTVSEVIVPGESKAELILSNGKKIDLSRTKDYSLRETNGTNIKNIENKLSYLKDSLSYDDKPLYNKINIPKGGEYLVTLSDGTKVWMNSMSSLKYPVNFGKNNRLVELSGEAFFEVTKDKNRPFIVKMKGYNVKVLGTSFNISAYHDEELIHTTLATGRVEISGLLGKEKEKYRILPGEQFVLNKYTRNTMIKDVDVRVVTAWKDGCFMFDETKFEDVLLELQRWYGVEIFYNNNDIKEEVFTGKLPKFENLNTILKMMSKVGNIKYRLKGNVLYIE